MKRADCQAAIPGASAGRYIRVPARARSDDTLSVVTEGTWRAPRKLGKGRVVGLAVIAFTLSACGNIEPWVKPYERQALADPIMALDPNPISTAYTHHVFEAREGARGALGSAGGGCGCN